MDRGIGGPAWSGRSIPGLLARPLAPRADLIPPPSPAPPTRPLAGEQTVPGTFRRADSPRPQPRSDRLVRRARTRRSRLVSAPPGCFRRVVCPYGTPAGPPGAQPDRSADVASRPPDPRQPPTRPLAGEQRCRGHFDESTRLVRDRGRTDWWAGHAPRRSRLISAPPGCFRRVVYPSGIAAAARRNRTDRRTSWVADPGSPGHEDCALRPHGAAGGRQPAYEFSRLVHVAVEQIGAPGTHPGVAGSSRRRRVVSAGSCTPPDAGGDAGQADTGIAGSPPSAHLDLDRRHPGRRTGHPCRSTKSEPSTCGGQLHLFDNHPAARYTATIPGTTLAWDRPNRPASGRHRTWTRRPTAPAHPLPGRSPHPPGARSSRRAHARPADGRGRARRPLRPPPRRDRPGRPRRRRAVVAGHRPGGAPRGGGLVGVTTWDAAGSDRPAAPGWRVPVGRVGMVLIWAVAGLVMLVFYVVAFGATTGVGLLLAWTPPTPAVGPTSQLAGLPHAVGGVAAFIIGAVGGFFALAGNLFNAVNQLYPAAAVRALAFWQPALLLAERPLPLANRDFWRQSRLLHLTAVGGILVAAAGVTALLYVALIPVWLAWLLLALCSSDSWQQAGDASPRTPFRRRMRRPCRRSRSSWTPPAPDIAHVDRRRNSRSPAPRHRFPGPQRSAGAGDRRQDHAGVSGAGVARRGFRAAHGLWTCEDERAKLNLGPAPVQPQVIVVDREVGPEARGSPRSQGW